MRRHRLCMWLMFGLSWGLVCMTCQAQPWLERVIDGDTLVIQADGQRLIVRLMDIDAPERHQAYGKLARQQLELLCRDAQLDIETHHTDRYGRTLAIVYCNGIDASAHQLASGLAWFNRRYAKRTDLQILEQSAQMQALGLWQEPEPIPPWEWRKQRQSNKQQ